MPNPTLTNGQFNWMLYGATGFTGQLILEEALNQGERPIIAGRDPAKVNELAQRFGLPAQVFGLLGSVELVQRNIQGLDAVVNAAGPFAYTYPNMAAACMQEWVDYLDITGEMVVFEKNFDNYMAARSENVRLICGMGFDVVPTDCLAKYVLDELPEASQLEIAILTNGKASAGTMRTMLEHAKRGSWARKEGRLLPERLARVSKTVAFARGEMAVASVPLGDLSTAYRHYQTPNIRAFMALPQKRIEQLNKYATLFQKAMKVKPLRKLVQSLLYDREKMGPDEHLRREGFTECWASATTPEGKRVSARLTSIEAYRMTATCAVKGIQHLRSRADHLPYGALTPAQAFGKDFILELPDTSRETLEHTEKAVSTYA